MVVPDTDKNSSTSSITSYSTGLLELRRRLLMAMGEGSNVIKVPSHTRLTCSNFKQDGNIVSYLVACENRRYNSA